MITKYDVGDKILIEAKIHKVVSDKKGEIKYLLDIPNTPNYAIYKEREIVGKSEECVNVSE